VSGHGGRSSGSEWAIVVFVILVVVYVLKKLAEFALGTGVEQ